MERGRYLFIFHVRSSFTLVIHFVIPTYLFIIFVAEGRTHTIILVTQDNYMDFDEYTKSEPIDSKNLEYPFSFFCKIRKLKRVIFSVLVPIIGYDSVRLFCVIHFSYLVPYFICQFFFSKIFVSM